MLLNKMSGRYTRVHIYFLNSRIFHYFNYYNRNMVGAWCHHWPYQRLDFSFWDLSLQHLPPIFSLNLLTFKSYLHTLLTPLHPSHPSSQPPRIAPSRLSLSTVSFIPVVTPTPGSRMECRINYPMEKHIHLQWSRETAEPNGTNWIKP